MSEARTKASLAAIRADLGQRLRSVRERLGESQARFAERLGVAKLAVLTYEGGSRCPGADHLFRLAESGADASYVVSGVPSLATPEARRQFASALAWVRHECSVASLQVSEAGIVEAAWMVFCELSKQTSTGLPDEGELRKEAHAAVERLREVVDVAR